MAARWYVILPQMKVVIEFYVVVSVITMLSSVFAYVYMMGGGRGGPGTSTMVRRALHLQRADQDQPAGHRLRRVGPAVPRVAAADRAPVRGPPAGQRRGAVAERGVMKPLREPDQALKHGILLAGDFPRAGADASS